MTERAANRGRPRAVSRGMLQEAAFELFLEQGYDRTTVDHIATRAGVSRATFFNYFGAKSDVFWVDVDDALDALADAFGQLPASAGSDPIAIASNALVSIAAEFGAARVPWVLTQYDAIGGAGELQASAMSRLSRFAGLLERFIERQGDRSASRPPVDRAAPPHSASFPIPRAAAYSLAGAVVAAAREWADAGTGRGGLQQYVHAAVGPLAAAFAASGSR
ncbi:TetR/AcrR family transcriptional regulator [Ruicaihuangia caeni]|uniref:Helix-turn-helix domain-containing protein n=1 Tax=Ruicaihuangia caeni TaxID=3042517 RepID=A0AAW6T622_9MICO|nr:TetR/AcrR family transcriptional regulator [Klugiella sp. YN-L-19]MDI2097813.1 helix-turn-helix domain-containing protein [Klugiella sp. YN-L-19]